MNTNDSWTEHARAIETLHGYSDEIESLCKKQGNRDWTDEETAEHARLCQAVSNTKARAERVEQTAAIKVPRPGSAIPRLHLPGSLHSQAVSTRRRPAFRDERTALAFGAFMRAITTKDPRAFDVAADFGVDFRAAMSTGLQSKGGAWVPDQFSPELIALVEEFGVFRRYSDISVMGSDTQIVPVESAGVTAYFSSENTEIPASDLTVDNVQLTAKKLAAMTVVSSELFEDSLVNLADRVARRIAIAFAEKEDDCGFNGDGTSTFGGIVGAVTRLNDGSHAGSIYTALTGNTAFNTLDLVDFEAVLGQLPQFPGATPRWFISKVGWAQSMLRLADVAGGTTKTMIEGRSVQEFLGFEVVWTRKLNSVITAQPNAIACLFGDLFQASIFGDRRAITIEADTGGEYFKKDQTALKGTERVDLVTHLGNITGSNAGPLIALKFPAS